MCKFTQPQVEDIAASKTSPAAVVNQLLLPLPLAKFDSHTVNVKNTFLNVDRFAADCTPAMRLRRSASDSALDFASDSASTDATEDEQSEQSWPTTPESSPRASAPITLPADGVFKTMQCVNNLIRVVTSNDVEALVSMALRCLPEDVNFVVSTPQWSSQLRGHDDICQFLRRFAEAFPDLSMMLEDVVHAQQACEPVQWRARCSGTQKFPMIALIPNGAQIQFEWQTACVKDEEGKTISLQWRFAPVFSQQMMQEMHTPTPTPICMPAMQLVPVSYAAPVVSHAQAANSTADDLLMQAERAKLAAASLRAIVGLEKRENRNVRGRNQRHLACKVTSVASSSSDDDSSSTTDEQTTVILRNIPLEYSRQMFLSMLDNEGFAGCYDFIYMPRDFQRSFGLGYVFVNFTSAECAQRVHTHFQGFCNWEIPSQKICEVGWSTRHQGLAEQIKRYRNSPVMHESVPDEYKPVLLRNGVRIEFPAPTQILKKPRGFDSA